MEADDQESSALLATALAAASPAPPPQSVALSPAAATQLRGVAFAASTTTFDGGASDPDLMQLRCLATPQFLKTFETGLNAYLGGRWEEAREALERADRMMASNDIGGDGPSRAILGYMKGRNWACPAEWSGHRPLTSK